MGTPKPQGRFVDQLLGPYWESSITVESLMALSTALTGASDVMLAKSQDGLVGAQKMMNSGTGMLVNAISLTWARIFVEVGVQGAQVAAAGVAVGVAQAALANAQFAMAGAAELYNGLLEEADAERKAGIKGADERFNTILTQGQKAIENISGSEAAAIPVWLSAPGQTPTAGNTATAQGPGQTPAATPAGNTTTAQGPGQTPAATPMPGSTPAGGSPSNPGSMSPGAAGSPAAPGSGSAGSAPNGAASPAAGGSSSAAPSAANSSPAAVSSPGSDAAHPSSTAGAGTGSSAPAGGSSTGAGESAPAAAASSQSAPSSGGSPAAAPTAGVAPMSGVAVPVAAVAGGLAGAGGAVSPVSAAGPIASAAAGAVPALPPVPPPAPPATTLSPVTPGSALAPPPPAAAAPPVPAPGVHAPAAGPSTGGPPPPSPQPAPAPGGSAPPSTAAPNSASQQAPQDGPGPSVPPAAGVTSGGAAPLIPVSGTHDPLIAPAAFVTPPAVFDQASPGSEDLAAVRITLEAVGGGDHVQWAAGMVAVSGSKQLVVTSDRGRGWMPPNAVLPANIELPWRHPEAAQWEGLLDPARVVVEYAAAVGGTLTALASTTMFSPPGVVADVPFAYVDATERAHPELLTSSILRGPIATRIELQVDQKWRDEARAVTIEAEQRQLALNCAYAAHIDAEKLSGGVGHSDARQRLFDVLRNRQGVAPARIAEVRPLWDELENERVALRDLEHAARVDVRDVAIGQLDNSGGDGLPYLVQGYATEAALGLLTASAAGAFSHALYYWAMLHKYPPTADAVAS